MTGRERDLTAEVLSNGFDDRLPVDEAARRRSFDAAMDAFDDALAPKGGRRVVVDLSVEPARRVPQRRGLPPLAMLSIAALMLVVAGAVIVLTRGGDERVRTGVTDEPLELPTPSATVAPVVVAEPADWSGWADEVDPAEALVCVTRTTFRELVDAELPPPNPVGSEPESQWALAQLRGVAGLGVALAPVVDSAAVPASARDADSVAAADAAAFADEGMPDETFVEQVAAVRSAMQSNVLWAPDPDRCWLDRPTTGSEAAELRALLGDEAAIRCLAAETVDRALAWQASDLDTDRTASVNDALVLFGNYTSGEDLDLLGLLGEISLLAPTDPEAAGAFQAARDDLAGSGLGLDESGCRVP